MQTKVQWSRAASFGPLDGLTAQVAAVDGRAWAALGKFRAGPGERGRRTVVDGHCWLPSFQFPSRYLCIPRGPAGAWISYLVTIGER